MTSIRIHPFARNTLIIITLIFQLFPRPSKAELSYLDLKGVDALVDHPGASPVFGYTALQTYLPNMKFLGNYGPKKEGMSCLEGADRIHELLVASQDCPQDYTSAWIQKLFPSQDGVNFVANQIDSDVTSHLTPYIIGRILERIASVPEVDWKNSAKLTKLEKEISDLLYQEFNPAGFKGELTSRLQKIQGREKRCPADERANLSVEKKEIQNLMAFLDSNATVTHAENVESNAEESKSGGELPSLQKLKKGIGKKKDFDEMAHFLVGALKEDRLATASHCVSAETHPISTAGGPDESKAGGGAEASCSPRHLPEQALLAFFIKKSNDKRDLLSLFEGMGSLVHDPEVLTDEGKKEHFLNQKWNKSEYNPASLSSNPEATARDFATHPEKLVFTMMQERLSAKSVPPILSYGSAHHKSLKGGTYPDCGETSVRNFFNILLFNPKTQRFDVGILDQLEEADRSSSSPTGLKFHTALRKYYTKRFDPALASSQRVRDDWSKVVSALSHVHYLKPLTQSKCEINAGVDKII